MIKRKMDISFYYLRGELPLERATSREKGQPLCMEQFYRLLGVCRIPEVGKDRLELPMVKNDPEEYEELVVVACRNHVSTWPTAYDRIIVRQTTFYGTKTRADAY